MEVLSHRWLVSGRRRSKSGAEGDVERCRGKRVRGIRQELGEEKLAGDA